MYKINQLIIVFIFLSASSNAQVNKIDIGIHGGLGISNIYGHTNLFNPTKLNTPTVGISLCLGINDYFNLVSNLSYETKGDKFIGVPLTDDFGNGVGSGNASLKFNYTTLNLLARGVIGRNLKFFANGGPFVGYLLNVKEISKVDNPINVNGSYYTGSNRDITTKFKKIDFGVTAGIGVIYPANYKYKFSFEVRRNIGLYNLSKLPMIDNGTLKTNSIGILAGIKLELF